VDYSKPSFGITMIVRGASVITVSSVALFTSQFVSCILSLTSRAVSDEQNDLANFA
jgi:hypothetical protein